MDGSSSHYEAEKAEMKNAVQPHEQIREISEGNLAENTFVAKSEKEHSERLPYTRLEKAHERDEKEAE